MTSLLQYVSPRAEMPFVLRELQEPTPEVLALFRKCFASPPPNVPRHYVGMMTHRSQAPTTCAYVHLSQFEPGVFLVGGLCVDVAIYRRLSEQQRNAVARVGSLSRWMLARSIEALGHKRAVFAYTGDTRSRRDCMALGFERAHGPYLIVQWHQEPSDQRNLLVERVERHGPF